MTSFLSRLLPARQSVCAHHPQSISLLCPLSDEALALAIYDLSEVWVCVSFTAHVAKELSPLPLPCLSPSLFHEGSVCFLGSAASCTWCYKCCLPEGQIAIYDNRNVFPKDNSCVLLPSTAFGKTLLDALAKWVCKTACIVHAGKVIFYRLKETLT